MDISVVIVNYNVKYFLEQCIQSVYRASHDVNTEIIVVDNNSVDGSCSAIEEKFPGVILIRNQQNVGFSKANNQGILKAKGKYILFLNPDTVVQEDTLKKCHQFMEKHEEAGCLGVKMIDGKGNFLPESKRALPTPEVAFYKIFGLASLFPKSKRFGRYHLGFLDRNKTHSIDILSGAFMFIRKEALEKAGFLDESFFMYGEDIDLSYRVLQAGYKNYYYPDTTIIHYKGESTKKGSINYVLVFYRAMIIFARKHFTKRNARLFSTLIQFAIYIRASVSILRRIITNLLLPVCDALLIFLGYYHLGPIWGRYKFGTPQYYPEEYLKWVVPGYILIWIFTLYYSGGYEKKVRYYTPLAGISAGSIVILLVYALLPESWRFSRALIILGILWSMMVVYINRLLLNIIWPSLQKLEFRKRKKRIIIIGLKEEADRVFQIINQTGIDPVLVGYVSIKEEHGDGIYLGTLRQLKEIVKINKVDELVFCARDLSSQQIIEVMLGISDISVDYKIAPRESESVIGSNSINTAGDFYSLHMNALSKEINKRKKRLLDIILAIILFALFPLFIPVIPRFITFISNCIQVLFGFKTWVGYYRGSTVNMLSLPVLKKGVLNPSDGTVIDANSEEVYEKLNILYAKDYTFWNDLKIIWKGFKKLGN